MANITGDIIRNVDANGRAQWAETHFRAVKNSSGKTVEDLDGEVNQLDQEMAYGVDDLAEVALDETITGFNINSSAYVNSASALKLYSYAVTKGDVLHITASDDGSSHVFRFGFVYSKSLIERTYAIPNVVMLEAASVDEIVSAPVTGYLIVYRGSYFTNIKVEKVTPVIPKVSAKADKAIIDVDFVGKALGIEEGAIKKLNGAFWRDGITVNYSTGATLNSSDYSFCNPFFLEGAKYLYLTMPVSTGTENSGLAFYGSDGTYISGVQQFTDAEETGLKPKQIAIPSGAYTFRVSIPTTKKDSFYAFLTDSELPEDGVDRELLEDYFDFYSAGLNKEVKIVGVAATGTGAGVKEVGDIFYNTSTDLLRQAVSQAGESTFNYQTVPPDDHALYVSPISQYRYINGVFTEVSKASLGVWGDVLVNKENIESLKERHLKICLLGNSYTTDCWRYVPFMLLNYGITCEIYLYYRGSGSLNDLNSQWEDYDRTGIAESDGNEHTRFCAYIDSRKNAKWQNYPTETVDNVTVNTMCAKDIVEVGNSIGGWDLVTLQQASVYTDVDPDNDTNGRYEHLTDIIDYIQEHCDYPFNLAWFQSYTRASHDSATIRTNSLANQEKLFEEYLFAMVIPVATAVFSARGNETLAALGDSDEHNLWADDDTHLQDGLPCYIGSLVVLQSLFNYFNIGKSVLNDTFRATADNVGSGEIGLDSTAQFPCVGITDANCRLAQKAAVLAVRKPSVISTI